MKFKVDVDITVNNQKDQEFNDEIGSAKGRSFNNPTLTPPQLSSNNPGKYELSYSIPNNPINIWNSEDSKTISSTNTSGTLLADIDDTSREYDFQVQYKLNKKYNSNGTQPNRPYQLSNKPSASMLWMWKAVTPS